VSLLSWVLCSMFVGVWLRPQLLLGSSLTASGLAASMAVVACNGMALLALGTLAPVRFDTTIACCRKDASRRWLASWSGAQALLAFVLALSALARDGCRRRLLLRLEILGAFGVVGYLASLRDELLCRDPRANSLPKRLAGLALYAWAALTFYLASRLEEHAHLRKDDDDDDLEGGPSHQVLGSGRHHDDEDDADDVATSVGAMWDRAAAKAEAMKKGSKTV